MAERSAPAPAAAPPAGPVRSPLSAEELGQFREMLVQKRGEIRGDMAAIHSTRNDSGGDLSTAPIHMAELGTDNYQMEFNLGLIESERALLHEIEDALDRIEKGTYGVCLGTGKPIGKARLKAMPWAKYSQEYTLLLERGRGQRY